MTENTTSAARIGSDLPAPTPPISVETQTFWTATTEGTLLLSRCLSCREYAWYPRGFCPHCGHLDVEWVPAAGTGTVYSYSIVRRGGLGDYRGAEPYVLAYVELDEGVRMMTNIVDVDEDELRIGLPVSVVFHRTAGEAALPRFTPAR
ncbi:Zn-ribbon domain-containing OB-fold protein [Brevibacterium daeguense]|uniref:Zn-ribbon domain-containing OB-fold protein n=1 Tax=Brevibacterium daeguense TaxID=909936 RepID=A0ABP8EFU5_9MICO|nr:Zn-ribbon domain-containing OB-fold protein [Brevibacterium daeguense]